MKLNKNVKIDKSYLLTIRYFQAQITRIAVWVFNSRDLVKFSAFPLAIAFFIFIFTRVTVQSRSCKIKRNGFRSKSIKGRGFNKRDFFNRLQSFSDVQSWQCFNFRSFPLAIAFYHRMNTQNTEGPKLSWTNCLLDVTKF